MEVLVLNSTGANVEAEYRAMAHTSCELKWIKYLLEELRFVVKLPMTIHYDNQAAIYIAPNPMFHEQTKHIEVDCHITREKVEDGVSATLYVSTRVQIANIFIFFLISKDKRYIDKEKPP